MYLILSVMRASVVAGAGLGSASISSPIASSGIAPACKMVINSFTKVSLACASNITKGEVKAGVGGTAGVSGPAGIAGTAGVLVPPQAHHGLAEIPGTRGVPGIGGVPGIRGVAISSPNSW